MSYIMHRLKAQRACSKGISKAFNQHGVSLVEILTVVSVLGTIAMLAYPNMMLALEDNRLNAAAGDITAAITYSRMKAANTGMPSRILIDVGSDRMDFELFKLPQSISDDVPFIDAAVVEAGSFTSMDHPFNPGAPYRLNLGGEGLFGGIDVTGAVFGSGSTITFDGLGAPADGGMVTVASGSHQRFIHVDALTGKITVTN